MTLQQPPYIFIFVSLQKNREIQALLLQLGEDYPLLENGGAGDASIKPEQYKIPTIERTFQTRLSSGDNYNLRIIVYSHLEIYLLRSIIDLYFDDINLSLAECETFSIDFYDNEYPWT